MAQRVFKMNGRKFYSIMDMAREVGVPRIYARDFGKFGIVEITGTPESLEPDSPVDTIDEVDSSKSSNNVQAELKETTELTDGTGKQENVVAKPNKNSKKTSHIYTVDELIKGTIEDFSKFLRKVSTEEIVEFARKDDINLFTEVTDEKIRRMRIVMEIKDKYFHNQSIPSKKSSFKGVDTDVLLKFADENKIEYKKSTDDKIQKMWVIYALTNAGYTELPNKEGGVPNGD